MERLDTHIGALDGALQQAPEVLHSVSVDVSLGVALGVVYDIVNVGVFQSSIGPEFIGQDFGSGLDSGADLTLKCSLLSAGDNLGLDGAVPVWPMSFQEAKNSSLSHRATALDLSFSDVLVHEASTATDESLIYFDLPAHLLKRQALHGKPNAMVHEPSALLGNAQSASHLVGADSVLAVGNHPESREPPVQTERAVFKDGSDLDRELLPATLALPELSRAQERRTFVIAAGALDAVWPAKTGDEVQADIFVGEELNSFDEGLW